MIFMHTVYILQDKNGRLYKGLTNDLSRRLKEHVNGKTKTTRSMVDLRLIYKEDYSDLITAREREIYFKTAAGRRVLKKLINMSQ